MAAPLRFSTSAWPTSSTSEPSRMLKKSISL
jgi:hypothetical protein